MKRFSFFLIIAALGYLPGVSAYANANLPTDGEYRPIEISNGFRLGAEQGRTLYLGESKFIERIDIWAESASTRNHSRLVITVNGVDLNRPYLPPRDPHYYFRVRENADAIVIRAENSGARIRKVVAWVKVAAPARPPARVQIYDSNFANYGYQIKEELKSLRGAIGWTDFDVFLKDAIPAASRLVVMGDVYGDGHSEVRDYVRRLVNILDCADDLLGETFLEDEANQRAINLTTLREELRHDFGTIETDPATCPQKTITYTPGTAAPIGQRLPGRIQVQVKQE